MLGTDANSRAEQGRGHRQRWVSQAGLWCPGGTPWRSAPPEHRGWAGGFLGGNDSAGGESGEALGSGTQNTAFCSFDGQMETDGEERGGGIKKNPKHNKKLSRVKINWNRMVVSVGWWLASAGGTWDIPPSLGPGAAARPIAPSHGSAPAVGQNHGENPTTRSQSHQSHHWPARTHHPQPLLSPLLGEGGRLRFGGEHLLVLKKFSEFQEHYVTLTRK